MYSLDVCHVYRDQVDASHAKEETNCITVLGLRMAPLGNIEGTTTKRMCTCHANTASFVLFVKATNFFVGDSTQTVLWVYFHYHYYHIILTYIY